MVPVLKVKNHFPLVLHSPLLHATPSALILVLKLERSRRKGGEGQTEFLPEMTPPVRPTDGSAMMVFQLPLSQTYSFSLGSGKDGERTMTGRKRVEKVPSSASLPLQTAPCAVQPEKKKSPLL